MGTGNKGDLGQIRPGFEQPPLAGRQRRVWKSPIEFVPVLEKAKGHTKEDPDLVIPEKKN
jgi:hypothetical protein